MELEHVALTIIDVKEIDDFYHKILGLEVHKKFEINENLSEKIFGISKNTSVYLMKRDNLLLELFVHPEMGEWQYNHICVSVENRDDFFEKVVVNGYTGIRIERENSDMIFIKDKSGNVFEIKET